MLQFGRSVYYWLGLLLFKHYQTKYSYHLFWDSISGEHPFSSRPPAVCQIFLIWLDAILSPFGELAAYPSPETFEPFSRQEDFWLALQDGLRNRWHSFPKGKPAVGGEES